MKIIMKSLKEKLLIALTLLVSSFIGETLFAFYRLYDSGRKINSEIPYIAVIYENLLTSLPEGIRFFCYIIIGSYLYAKIDSKYWPIKMAEALLITLIIDLFLDYASLRITRIPSLWNWLIKIGAIY